MIRASAFAGLCLFALMAGFFWSFSVVVMPGLGRLDPTAALGAMQAINVAVRNAVFAAGFFGAALLSPVLVVAGLVRRDWLTAAAGAVYLALVFAVTLTCNVPINEALAALTPADAPAAAVLLDRWVWWNHLRSAASAAAFVLLLGPWIRRDGPAAQG